MKKRLISLLLTVVMLLSLMAIPANAALVSGTGTLTITPNVTSVKGSASAPIEVIYTIKVTPPAEGPVGEFHFNLKAPDGMTLSEVKLKPQPANKGGDGYWVNMNDLWYNPTTEEGVFETFEYTPASKYFQAFGTSASRNMTAEAEIMTIKATIAAGKVGDFTLTAENVGINKNGTDSYSVDIKTTPVTVTSAISNDLPVAIAKPEKGVTPETAISGTNYTGSIAWTPAVTGGKFAANTEYTANVKLTAKDGYQFASDVNPTVTNATSVTDKNVAADGKTLTFKAAFPKTGSVTVTKVQIAGTPPSLNVPEALGIDTPKTVKVTNTYSVTVFMDGSPVVNPDGVKWSVSGLEGVTVDPDTGDMTISSDCPGGGITLTATYGGVSSKPATLTVWRDAPVVKWLKIVDPATGGEPQTTIIRPVGTELTDRIQVEYKAKVYDQFSQPVNITDIKWAMNPSPNHIGTTDIVDQGIRQIRVFHNTDAISFDLTAALTTNPAIKGTVKITVAEKPLETLTVTQADTTYGTPLADPVFTKPEGTINTTVHYSTPTSSGYSSDTPPTNAGAYVVNVLCETATHIYMGHADFKIEPKSISNMLQPITGTYTYTGAPQNPPAVVMDGTKTLVKGTDYNVRYGTNVHVFEVATVYVDGIGNYTGTFSRNFKIQPKPIDITSVSTTDRDYEEGNVNVECTVTLPVASDVKQGTHYLVFATMADDTAGTNKTVNVQVKMVKGDRGENYTLNKDTATAKVNINQINPADPTGLKGVKGNALSTVELPAGWNWDAPATLMNTAGSQTFKAHYAGDANHIAVSAHPITVYVLDKTDVSSFITFPDGEKEYTGSWMKYEEASISGTNLGTGAKWNYVYTAGTGTLMAAGFPEGIGTYTVTATYEDSINFGIATATLTIVPKKVAIPAADTTVFTYDGTAKTYGISDTADYTVTGNSQTNAGDHTVTVALRDKATTAWADGTTADKTYTFTIKQATPTGEPAYTKITTSGKTLADAGLTVTGSTLNPNAGTLDWVDDAGNVLSDTTTVAANTTYKWRFTPADANYKALTGSIELYHKSSSSGGGGGSSHSSRYTITVDSVKHGTITVSPKSAYKGDTVTITVKPDKGYELDTLKVLDKDGDKVKITEKKGKYTFTMPASKVTIKGKFVEEAPEQIFADVPVDAYCYEAVKWAASEGITGGIGNNLFAPGLPCTRGQIVTFLWRAAGSPAPKSMSSFADVAEDAYYAKAVAWAVENGITGGTGNGKFSPDATCTRAQAVTFLYRASGSPAVSGSAAFSDVAADAYYADAVKWAEKNGITGGIGGGLFGSGNNCTRGQIVTFLYRSVK